MGQIFSKRTGLDTRRIVLSAATALAALALWTPAASGIPRAGCQTVHVGPEIAPGTAPSSYFQLTVQPGASTRAALLAANPERYSCNIGLVAAYGQTALNSGDTYPVAGQPGRGCVRTSCWLSGLPRTITIPAGRRVLVPFSVSVPRGTSGGQYLAGIVTSPGASPAAPQLAAGHSQVGARIVSRVAIGVAMTVPGALSPQLSIPTVKLDPTSAAPVLQVAERDLGNTWEHPEGQAVITTSEPFHPLSLKFVSSSSEDPVTFPLVRSYGITSATVLPGDSATLPLSVGQVPRGTWPTEVTLWYDHHRKVAVWRGNVDYSGARSDSGANDGTSSDPSPMAGLPLWAKIMIGGLAAVSAVLACLLVLLLKRRRRER